MDNAGETRSDARMASEGPRATGTLRPGGLSYRCASRRGCLLHRDQEVSPTGMFGRGSRLGGAGDVCLQLFAQVRHDCLAGGEGDGIRHNAPAVLNGDFPGVIAVPVPFKREGVS